MRTIIKLLLFTTIIFITNCSSKINLSQFSPYTLQKTKYMPTKEELKAYTKTKIIIANIDDKNINIAKRANLGKTIEISLGSILSTSKTVHVLKRIQESSFQKMIKEEIKIAEIGKETGDDVGQADYIITGKLSNTSYTNSYIPGYYYTKVVNGVKKELYQPSKTIYESCVQGNIRVLKLPTLDEKLSEPFNECSTKTNYNRLFVNTKTRDDALVRSAGARASKKVSYALQNFFSKKGYIYEAKIKDDKIILKTTLGTDFGAKQDSNVEIFTIEKSYNQLTNKTSKIEVLIGSGTISNQINNDFSWIIVDDIKDTKSIHIGDYIKIIYGAGFWDF